MSARVLTGGGSIGACDLRRGNTALFSRAVFVGGDRRREERGVKIEQDPDQAWHADSRTEHPRMPARVCGDISSPRPHRRTPAGGGA